MLRYHINKLERILNEKYPKINVSIYILKRTKIAHMDLNKALYDFENYLHVIKDIKNFFF